MSLTQIDPLMGWHVPVKNRAAGDSAHGHIKITKNSKGQKHFRLTILKTLREAIKEEVHRISFRFDGDEVFVVFNADTSAGIPFYKVRTSYISNRDLVQTIGETLEGTTKVDTTESYTFELVPIENFTHKGQIKKD
jgi:hypothetical protein